MTHHVTIQYANLLTNYCLQVQPGDKVFIASTLLAEPLVREVYRAAYAAGASLVECDLAFRERERLFVENASTLPYKQSHCCTVQPWKHSIVTSIFEHLSTCVKTPELQPYELKCVQKHSPLSIKITSKEQQIAACAETCASGQQMLRRKKPG